MFFRTLGLWEQECVHTIGWVSPMAAHARVTCCADFLLEHTCNHPFVGSVEGDHSVHGFLVYGVDPSGDFLFVPICILKHLFDNLSELVVNLVGGELFFFINFFVHLLLEK